jgi:glutamine synthetase
MQGRLDLESLTQAVAEGRIDTVVVAQTDMQGRLMGKRFQAEHFLAHGHHETHACNYLLATDMEMVPVPGYAAASWARGYGDHVMKPDLSTLRVTPWLEGTALVLCDVLDPDTGVEVLHSPRAVLKRQIERLAERGFRALMASELEFYLFDTSYADAATSGYRHLPPTSNYNEDYHIFQTTKEEGVMRALRNGLQGAGVPVENSKGEASAGQQEINIRYAEALTAADWHVVVKNAAKEIAWQRGRAVTFLAKFSVEAAGSSAHLHQSLWHLDGTPAFAADAAAAMAPVMRQYLAGLLKYAREGTLFLAPHVNSYKRFVADTFAPTHLVWSSDNRTAGYRIVGHTPASLRIECRIGGSDLNPYLALAAQIAAGIAGIDEGLDLEPPFVGDAYRDAAAPRVPGSLRDALLALEGSTMFRGAFGPEVVDHYLHAGRWEEREYLRVVTDWEVARGFERA